MFENSPLGIPINPLSSENDAVLRASLSLGTMLTWTTNRDPREHLIVASRVLAAVALERGNQQLAQLAQLTDAAGVALSRNIIFLSEVTRWLGDSGSGWSALGLDWESELDEFDRITSLPAFDHPFYAMNTTTYSNAVINTAATRELTVNGLVIPSDEMAARRDDYRLHILRNIIKVPGA